MTTSSTKTRPTHHILAVTKNGNKKFYQRIGALWAHADGKGFNQIIEYLPLNGAEIIIRVAGEKEAEAGGDAQ
jgi:hypothetical protein